MLKFCLCFFLILSMGKTLKALNICQNPCPGNQASEKCLKTNYSCGRYRDIVALLTMERTGLTLLEKYYLGISYYGLFFQSSLNSDKCQYARLSKNVLRDYMLEMSNIYHSSGTWGSQLDFEAVYHATKLYKLADEFAGCLNDGMTSEEASLIIKEQTVHFIDNIFLDNNSREMANAKSTLFDQVNSIVSMASDFETKMALKLVELNTAKRHLDNIFSIFQNNFGSGSSKEALKNKRSIDQYQKLSTLNKKYKGVYKESDDLMLQMKSVFINGNSSSNWFDVYQKNQEGSILLIKDTESQIIQSYNQTEPLFGPNESVLMDLIYSYNNLGENLLKDSLLRIVDMWPDLKKSAQKK